MQAQGHCRPREEVRTAGEPPLPPQPGSFLSCCPGKAEVAREQDAASWWTLTWRAKQGVRRRKHMPRTGNRRPLSPNRPFGPSHLAQPRPGTFCSTQPAPATRAFCREEGAPSALSSTDPQVTTEHSGSPVPETWVTDHALCNQCQQNGHVAIEKASAVPGRPSPHSAPREQSCPPSSLSSCSLWPRLEGHKLRGSR